MRHATHDDVDAINEIGKRCGMQPLPADILETCLAFVGEHGYIILDMQDSTHCIAHATVAPEGRGKWSIDLMKSCIRWLFTSTKVECIRAIIRVDQKNVIAYATDTGFKVMGKTRDNVFMMCDIFTWMINDPECLARGGHAGSDFPYSDPEMVKRVTGACTLMHEAGMEHKAWYIYQLYAKLFGYKAED